MNKYEIGVTAPPFHPWCRGTTAPYFEDMQNIGERWARDADGKSYEVPKSMTYRQWKKKYVDSDGKSGIISSGAKGALTSKNDPDYTKREAHAKTYYRSVRNSDKDSIVNAISKNVDLSRAKVEAAINHLFFSKHYLEKGYAYFDEDYDIAETIQRLRDGRNIQPHDLILIKHEALEADYMSNGMPFDEAHSKAESKYNYALALREFLEANDLE